MEKVEGNGEGKRESGQVGGGGWRKRLGRRDMIGGQGDQPLPTSGGKIMAHTCRFHSSPLRLSEGPLALFGEVEPQPR